MRVAMAETKRRHEVRVAVPSHRLYHPVMISWRKVVTIAKIALAMSAISMIVETSVLSDFFDGLRFHSTIFIASATRRLNTTINGRRVFVSAILNGSWNLQSQSSRCCVNLMSRHLSRYRFAAFPFP